MLTPIIWSEVSKKNPNKCFETYISYQPPHFGRMFCKHFGTKLEQSPRLLHLTSCLYVPLCAYTCLISAQIWNIEYQLPWSDFHSFSISKQDDLLNFICKFNRLLRYCFRSWAAAWHFVCLNLEQLSSVVDGWLGGNFRWWFIPFTVSNKTEIVSIIKLVLSRAFTENQSLVIS